MLTTEIQVIIPQPLVFIIAKLKAEKPDFAERATYQKLLREYTAWPAQDLLCRLRTLCSDPVGFELEICAAADALASSPND